MMIENGSLCLRNSQEIFSLGYTCLSSAMEVLKKDQNGTSRGPAESTTFDENCNCLYDYGRMVWARDFVDGFQLGRLVDIGAQKLTVELLNQKIIVKASYEDVLSAEENLLKDVDDNCALMYLNEATLLNNCRIRYSKKKIYTYVANILISINPYENIPDLYSDATIQQYHGKSLGTMPPHIFAITDHAYRDMKRLKRSQSIIVSGESGAGKTESQKCVLRYLCHCWGSTAGPIEQRILETNPILEAFGNAKTLRNNNSSRFGKFVEIHFNEKHQMAGGFVSHYLLEKSRVCIQQSGERNFHVFYQLFTDEHNAKKLRLSTPQAFNYLRAGCTQFFANSNRANNENLIVDPMVDDFLDFVRLRSALRDIGFSDAELQSLLELLAGILHLGNVEFDEKSDDSKGGSRVLQRSETYLANAAEFLGVETAQLRMGLVSRMMQPTKGGVKGTLIMVPLRCRECRAARDALSKSLYSRLFNSIVAKINESIPFHSTVTSYFIGILDIAGFEFFEMNSFEQFCINYCNEKLQQFFNDRILKQEQRLYETEGLNIPKIHFVDNQECIELFEQKKTGLLDLLDEEARLPKSSTEHFTLIVQQTHQKHSCIAPTRKAVERRYREMRESEGFMVHHYAAAVCYETAGFLEKNNDALHESLEMMLQESSNPLIKALCTAAGASSRNGSKKSSKLNVPSVSNKFRAQLTLLIEKLNNTGTHFVRCVKPNSRMAAGQFAGAQILDQLKCAGMASVLRLMQKGYPSRTSFAELYKMYESVLPPRLARLDSRLFCKCLFYALGLSDSDYKFGMTKAFFRAGKFAEFDRLMKQDANSMQALIEKVVAWIHHVRWRKMQYGVWSCIKLKNKIAYRAAHLVKIQSGFRGALARKIHRPRIYAFRKLAQLRVDGAQLYEIVNKSLNNETRVEWNAKIRDFAAKIDDLTRKVKSIDSLNVVTQKAIEDECAIIQKRFNVLLADVKAQVKSDESERIRRLQECAQKQRDLEAAEIRERKEQQKILEERRQLEMQRQKMLALEAERQCQPNVQQKVQNDVSTTTTYKDVTTQGMQTNEPAESATSAYNLMAWTYAKLRDAINTSTNIEFLEACREEFHRRLSAYHTWKTNNEKASATTADSKITGMFENGVANSIPSRATVTEMGQRIQRYFRIPFEKPVGVNDYSVRNQKSGTTTGSATCGFWYAHFDGQFVVRQMEIHPNKAPLLLAAGRHDAKMCELSLDQTRLMHKKGAEILARDFDAVWKRYGGEPYCSNSNSSSKWKL